MSLVVLLNSCGVGAPAQTKITLSSAACCFMFPRTSSDYSKDSNNAERGLCCYDQVTSSGDEDDNDMKQARAAVSTHHICQTCDTFTCLQ